MNCLFLHIIEKKKRITRKRVTEKTVKDALLLQIWAHAVVFKYLSLQKRYFLRIHSRCFRI